MEQFPFDLLVLPGSAPGSSPTGLLGWSIEWLPWGKTSPSLHPLRSGGISSLPSPTRPLEHHERGGDEQRPPPRGRGGRGAAEDGIEIGAQLDGAAVALVAVGLHGSIHNGIEAPVEPDELRGGHSVGESS